MSCMLGILILRYNQLYYEIPFVSVILFSAGQNCVYLWKNYCKSDSDGVFSTQDKKLLECFHK